MKRNCIFISVFQGKGFPALGAAQQFGDSPQSRFRISHHFPQNFDKIGGCLSEGVFPQNTGRNGCPSLFCLSAGMRIYSCNSCLHTQLQTSLTYFPGNAVKLRIGTIWQEALQEPASLLIGKQGLHIGRQRLLSAFLGKEQIALHNAVHGHVKKPGQFPKYVDVRQIFAAFPFAHCLRADPQFFRQSLL